MQEDARPMFFIHVMKTAGTTLKFRLDASYPPEQVYPNPVEDESLVVANTMISYLVDLPPERKARIRAYAGHFPYIAAELLGVDVATVTVLRDPVDRVVSHVRQVKRNPQGWMRWAEELSEVEDPTLEQIYDDPFLKPRFFLDHQVKVFSMTRDDNPSSYVDLFDVDEGRLEIAKTHLDRVDLIGLTEDYEAFTDELSRRLGLSDQSLPRLQAATDSRDVSSELRERIAAENALDRQFYDFAVELVAERRREA